jgi:hypothetical protein
MFSNHSGWPESYHRSVFSSWVLVLPTILATRLNKYLVDLTNKTYFINHTTIWVPTTFWNKTANCVGTDTTRGSSLVFPVEQKY